MKKKVILILAVICFLLQNATAQQHPWEKYVYKPRVQTLSNGKYEEFHDMDTIVQIGSVIFDRYNGKIIGKASPDTILGEPEIKPYIVSRWMSPDPLSEEYTGWSPYNYCMNNPIRFIDPDGRFVDDYYYSMQGTLIRHDVNNKPDRTFVENGFDAFNGGTQWKSVLMPGIIAGKENAQYQKYDHVIAIETHLFNQKLNNSPSELPTKSGIHSLATDANMPNNLDPTLVKAIMMRESGVGTGQGPNGTDATDPMQVNNPGDWTPEKGQVGLTENTSYSPQSNVRAGVGWLYLKGMQSDSKARMSWGEKNGNWDNAVRDYNGSDHKEQYKSDVLNYKNNTVSPKTEHYDY